MSLIKWYFRAFIVLPNSIVVCLLFFSLFTGCRYKKSNLDSCFEYTKSQLDSDSIINSIKGSPLESYSHFSHLIHSASHGDSAQICLLATEEFSKSHKNYSVSQLNLILFQYFQAYLRDEPFDEEKAIHQAIDYELKMNQIIHPRP